jgi:hypothetical protein
MLGNWGRMKVSIQLWDGENVFFGALRDKYRRANIFIAIFLLINCGLTILTIIKSFFAKNLPIENFKTPNFAHERNFAPKIILDRG